MASTWISISMTIPQAALAPIFSSVADTFQSRKWMIVGLQIIGVIGAAIAPGSSNIYRLIAAQTLVGFALISVPLTNCIPSEILPRKWRPGECLIQKTEHVLMHQPSVAQAIYNFAANTGGVVAPLIIGGLTKANSHRGWRTYFVFHLP